MVLPAPRVDEVLPALLEFIGAAVIVGHNIRFDISFLDAALVRRGVPPLENPRADTLGMSRRLLHDEVDDLKLGTLARHLRVKVEPCHRALADVDATAEVFHALLERAGTFGVLALDDLLALPKIRLHPSTNKLRLTTRLPRRPGVYRFRDRNGTVLYVGRAANLRTSVRSHFRGDRRKVPQLVCETESIDWIECADELEASVREARLIREHEPRFNRRGRGLARLCVPEADVVRTLPASRRRAPGARRRRALLRPARFVRGRHRAASRHRSRGAHPPLQHAHPTPIRCAGRRAVPDHRRPGRVPVPGPRLRARIRNGGGDRRPRAAGRARRAARLPHGANRTRSPPPTSSKPRRSRATSGRPSPACSATISCWTGSAAPGPCASSRGPASSSSRTAGSPPERGRPTYQRRAPLSARIWTSWSSSRAGSSASSRRDGPACSARPSTTSPPSWPGAAG